MGCRTFACTRMMAGAVRFASQDVKRKLAAVFVFTASEEPNRVVGYYTLPATSVELSGLPDEAVNRLQRYPQVPGSVGGKYFTDSEPMGPLFRRQRLPNLRQLAHGIGK